MTWIKIIPYLESAGRLRQLFDRVKGPGNNVDNILLAHGLRPHTLKGHMVLYKNVLHHKDNELPKRLLEMIGVYVSALNGCDYCFDHHFEGLKRHLLPTDSPDSLKAALRSDDLEVCTPKERAVLNYAKKLTLTPAAMQADDLAPLRENGLSDGQILEVNQVVSYFNYANRTVLGLGVNTEGDILGLSPGDDSDENNWGHH
ncbi:MAG: alkylhydroperoxidase [Bacteroidetes bacterium]|nr:MAG: alkylhydroperoxidase [Bacteroidota bacterium]